MSLMVHIYFPDEPKLDDFTFVPVEPEKDGDYGLRQCLDMVMRSSHNNFVQAHFIDEDKQVFMERYAFEGKFLRPVDSEIVYQALYNHLGFADDIPF